VALLLVGLHCLAEAAIAQQPQVQSFCRGWRRAHKKGFKTEVLKPLMPVFNLTLNQKFCNGIAAVCGVCRA
jgi:hypothetical protein